MEQTTNKPSRSLFFIEVWASVTVLYLVLQILLVSFRHPGQEGILGYLWSAVGMFVPVGLFGAISLVGGVLDYMDKDLFTMSVTGLVVFVGGMFLLHRYVPWHRFRLATRLILALLALFLFTMCMDFIEHSPFESIKLFANGGHIKPLF